jgi:LacI family transcriptional regulator
MAQKKVSINDIAKSLGVSKTLVSLVLNNHADEHGIAKKTQKRVHDKVREMNYKPNLMARGLRLGKSNTIGLIVSDISNPFYSKIARHLEDLVTQKGYTLIICSTDEKIDKEIKLTRMLRNRQVDGLVISSSQEENHEFQHMLKEHFPFVLIDRQIPNLEAHFVGVDNFNGAHKATSQLIKQGYKRIAVFAVTPVHVSSIHDRVEGYFQALKDHKLPVDKSLYKKIPFDNIKHSVEAELTSLMKSDKKIDALFAVNNRIALACLEVMSEMKINMPNDLALICFDDIELFKFNNPPISAISQPIEEIAKRAAEILFDEILSEPKESKKKKVEKLKTDLILRHSSAKL